MDNFTHSLVGWAIGQTGLKTRTRKGLAALVLAANMPDIDVFFGWVPWEPLATHRGVTHSLVVGLLIMPPILAGLLLALDRWQVRRGAVFKSGLTMHFPWLLALCCIGAATHPLLDLQTSYAVQLLSPFSTRWFHTETLFIIDVWIWSVLAFAIWLSRRRERRGGEWRRPPAAALGLVCVYIALNGAITWASLQALDRQLGSTRPDVVIANEQPVLFWKRSLVWRQGGLIGQAQFDPLRDQASVHAIRPLVPDNMGLPIVLDASRGGGSIRAFMRWSIMPMAQVHPDEEDCVVAFGDARFGVPAGRSRLMQTVRLPGAAAQCRMQR